MVSIGERVRKARKKAGLSARALSKAAGLSPAHVTILEGRAGGVDASTLAKIAAALGVTVDSLCT